MQGDDVISEIIHGDASGNQLNAGANKTQVYGLAGNDTLTSGKSDVFLGIFGKFLTNPVTNFKARMDARLAAVKTRKVLQAA